MISGEKKTKYTRKKKTRNVQGKEFCGRCTRAKVAGIQSDGQKDENVWGWGIAHSEGEVKVNGKYTINMTKVPRHLG